MESGKRNDKVMKINPKRNLSMVVVGVILFLFPFSSFLITSCTSIECSINNLVRTRFQFTNSDGDSISLLDTLTIVTTRKDGSQTMIFNSDSIIYNKGVGTCKFHLPISQSHPEDVLVFHIFGDSVDVTDTLWVMKEDYPHFESVDCNPTYFHKLTSIRHTHNCLDSVVIVNSSVTNDDRVVHVNIYPKISD